jgi:hypothetical protein
MFQLQALPQAWGRTHALMLTWIHRLWQPNHERCTRRRPLFEIACPQVWDEWNSILQDLAGAPTVVVIAIFDCGRFAG